MDRKFLRPFAVSVAVLLSAGQAQAGVPNLISAKTAAVIASAEPQVESDLVLDRASDAVLQFAQHASHSSHSSHASHSSHSSHASSSF